MKAISGTANHVRDGDAILRSRTAIRLWALDCPESETDKVSQAEKVAKQLSSIVATFNPVVAKICSPSWLLQNQQC